MCVYSMVMDHYDPYVPSITVPISPWPNTTVSPDAAPISVDDWRKLLEDIAKAQEAARAVDKLTGQPDCVDPEKARLEDRVRELEALLVKPPEFVVVQGGGLEPGTYRVIDGKLYKAL